MAGAAIVALIGPAATSPALAEAPAVQQAEAPRSMTVARLKPRIELPKVLSDADVELYRKIFDAQELARWAEADKLTAQVQNKVLLGHVQSHRYLHYAYTAKFAELKNWLDKYADLPAAERIYAMALKKRPRGAAAPRAPVGTLSHREFWEVQPGPVLPQPALNAQQQRLAAALQREFDLLIKRERLDAAAKVLERKTADALLGPARLDNNKLTLAARYFYAGRSDKALEWGQPAAKRSGALLAEAHWIAGLAAWHQKKYDDAVAHFTAVAEANNESDWMVSAGGFWAARALIAAGRPKDANKWLELAAKFQRTFYGMLARHTLGIRHEFNWTVPSANPQHLAQLRATPGGERGFALAQIGVTRWAEEELARLYIYGHEDKTNSFVAIADSGDMPGLAYRIGQRLIYKRNHVVDVSLYPLPHWEPRDGYTLDRAVIFAVMRQESAFMTDARSTAGARGLMQLMPGTASFIAGDRLLRQAQTDRLYDPLFNVELGQKFLRFLLEQPGIGGNLLYAFAAYNAGEGSLNKWVYREDPLLFLEGIAFRETRIYTRRVMYNEWVYRIRLGQPTYTLDALANGKQPIYRQFDTDIKVPFNARN
ncbi:MAG: transglycosylase SLT domain-containing protein [Alphaproteobacteria bacterium]